MKFPETLSYGIQITSAFRLIAEHFYMDKILTKSLINLCLTGAIGNIYTTSPLVMAILSDFDGESPERVIRSIIERLKRVSTNQAALRKYISQLQVFSQLRKLDNETDKIYSNMPLTINLEENAGFKRVYKKGIEKGLEKGADNTYKLVITQMLKNKVDLEEIMKYTGVSKDYILEIQEELNKK